MILSTFHSQSQWTSGTRCRLLTLRSMCQTGGPQSSPSRRAALGTGQTGEKQTNIRQAASHQADERHAFISARVCVYGVKTPLERSRERRRNTKLLTLPPWKLISVPLQQRERNILSFLLLCRKHRGPLRTVSCRKLPCERCCTDERRVCLRSHWEKCQFQLEREVSAASPA